MQVNIPKKKVVNAHGLGTVLSAGVKDMKISHAPTSENTRKLVEKLKDLSVEDLHAPINVLTALDTDSLLTSLQTMVNNKVSSMPVLEERGDGHHVLDFIDMLDIAYVIADFATETQNIPVHYSSPMNDLRLKDMTTGEAIKKCGRQYHQMSNFLTSALDVVHAICTHKMRRVLVNDGEGHIQTVVTQSNVAEWLWGHKELIPAHNKLTLTELGIGKRKVTSVNTFANAINAIKLMAYDRVSCVAVLDDKNHVTGVLTSRDLRAIFMSKNLSYEMKELYDKMPEFMAKVRSGEDGLSKKLAYTVTLNNTFEEVLDIFHATKIHHLVVVDEKQAPIGVVTLTDLLSTLIMTNSLIS